MVVCCVEPLSKMHWQVKLARSGVGSMLVRPALKCEIALVLLSDMVPVGPNGVVFGVRWSW